VAATALGVAATALGVAATALGVAGAACPHQSQYPSSSTPPQPGRAHGDPFTGAVMPACPSRSPRRRAAAAGMRPAHGSRR
jgi:hypothetical protein